MVAPVHPAEKAAGVFIECRECCSERGQMKEADQETQGKKMLLILCLQLRRLESNDARVGSDRFVKLAFCGFIYFTLAYSFLLFCWSLYLYS